MTTRTLLVAALGAAALTGLAPAAWAAPADMAVTTEQAAATLAPGRYVWNDDPSIAGDVSVVVSLADQLAYIYRGSTLVAATTVSTGRTSKPTPVGIFPILQKETMHHSNLYDSAAMPFMQRLTWDGVAIHAGVTPGYRSSHGCIHVPAAFAKKLFAITDVGSTVEVTDEPMAIAVPSFGTADPYDVAPAYEPAPLPPEGQAVASAY